MDLEKRVSNLEHLVGALINTINRNNFYNDADKNGIRQTENNHGVAIESNSEGINENDNAICDVAELSDVNSQAIDDLAEMVDELANQIAEMEA